MIPVLHCWELLMQLTKGLKLVLLPDMAITFWAGGNCTEFAWEYFLSGADKVNKKGHISLMIQLYVSQSGMTPFKWVSEQHIKWQKHIHWVSGASTATEGTVKGMFEADILTSLQHYVRNVLCPKSELSSKCGQNTISLALHWLLFSNSNILFWPYFCPISAYLTYHPAYSACAHDHSDCLLPSLQKYSLTASTSADTVQLVTGKV